eukprot:RCo010601
MQRPPWGFPRFCFPRGPQVPFSRRPSPSYYHPYRRPAPPLQISTYNRRGFSQVPVRRMSLPARERGADAGAGLSEKILLVFDLDGVLVDREMSRHAHPFLKDSPSLEAGPFVVKFRPHLGRLQAFLAAHSARFEVMVWSSARAANVARVVAALFPPSGQCTPVAVWGREMCTQYWLPPQAAGEDGLSEGVVLNNRGARPGVDYALTKKDLRRIWESKEPGLAGRWGPSNTILIDDDPEKCSEFPGNALHPRSFDATKFSTLREYLRDPELLALTGYLDGLTGDVQAYLRDNPYTEPDQ